MLLCLITPLSGSSLRSSYILVLLKPNMGSVDFLCTSEEKLEAERGVFQLNVFTVQYLPSASQRRLQGGTGEYPEVKKKASAV